MPKEHSKASSLDADGCIIDVVVYVLFVDWMVENESMLGYMSVLCRERVPPSMAGREGEDRPHFCARRLLTPNA